jgi:hypothetical protein
LKLVFIGVVGIAFLSVVAINRYQQAPPISEAELLLIGKQDDPKLGNIAPPQLRPFVTSKESFVVYLPECSGCTVLDPLSNPLPEQLKSAIFVKRTADAIPVQVPISSLLIDKDGAIQIALNANRPPRVYRFSNGHLADFQALDQSVEQYLLKESH